MGDVDCILTQTIQAIVIFKKIMKRKEVENLKG
jgi:hypothetical protein